MCFFNSRSIPEWIFTELVWSKFCFKHRCLSHGQQARTTTEVRVRVKTRRSPLGLGQPAPPLGGKVGHYWCPQSPGGAVLVNIASLITPSAHGAGRTRRADIGPARAHQKCAKRSCRRQDCKRNVVCSRAKSSKTKSPEQYVLLTRENQAGQHKCKLSYEISGT